MADHNFDQPLKCAGPWSKLVYCQFVTAGVGAITGFTSQGIVSAARTGVGTFELTFPTGWKNIQPVGLTVGGAAAVQLGRPTIRSITQSTKKVVVATVESDAAPIDIETTGVTIYCTFLLRYG
jgi:hypothetical protein